MKQILMLGSHKGRRYTADFIREAQINNNIFEVLSYNMTTNIAVVKSNITPVGYWKHRLNTFDKIVPDRRIDYSMNDLDKYFEIEE